jgi:hypothetical protein
MQVDAVNDVDVVRDALEEAHPSATTVMATNE